MTKSNFKKNIYDVIVISSPRNVTKLTSQDFSIMGPSQSKFLAKPVMLLTFSKSLLPNQVYPTFQITEISLLICNLSYNPTFYTNKISYIYCLKP